MSKPHIKFFTYGRKRQVYVAYVGAYPFINQSGYELGWSRISFAAALENFFRLNQAKFKGPAAPAPPPAVPLSAAVADPAATPASAPPYPTTLPGLTTTYDEPAPYRHD